MKKMTFVWIGLASLLVIGILGYGAYSASQPGQYEAFAQCITDSGAKFYGAFWCPHCQDQKAAFGKSEKLLPYIECSTADGQGQTEVCKEAQITGYPTWQFADGSRLDGFVQMQALAEKTSCPLPQ